MSSAVSASLFEGSVPLSLYDASIPMFIKNLHILSDILEKARVHAAGNDGPLVGARLIADMAPLAFQIQRVSDSVKITANWLGGVEDVVMEDTETTFEELQERITKTIALVEPLKPDCMDGKEHIKMRSMTKKGVQVPYNGKQLVYDFAIPNFFFHMSMAYAILRKEGVDIGKDDFLGNL